MTKQKNTPDEYSLVARLLGLPRKATIQEIAQKLAQVFGALRQATAGRPYEALKLINAIDAVLGTPRAHEPQDEEV